MRPNSFCVGSVAPTCDLIPRTAQLVAVELAAAVVGDATVAAELLEMTDATCRHRGLKQVEDKTVDEEREIIRKEGDIGEGESEVDGWRGRSFRFARGRCRRWWSRHDCWLRCACRIGRLGLIACRGRLMIRGRRDVERS